MALLSGTFAGLTTNPLELFKVRAQSGVRGNGTFQVIKTAVAELGFFGLWRGAVPATSRAAILTASQLVSYGESKRLCSRLLARHEDSIAVHVAAAMTSGLVATTVTNPLDVVKTRLMTDKAQGQNPSMFSVARTIMKTEGVRGFGKGWIAAYARLGPQTLLILVFLERTRSMFGLKSV